MKLPEILYEDKHVFVFNKPAGLMVHADGRTKEATLSDMLLKKYPKMKNVGEPMRFTDKEGEEKIIYRPGIVHRLDKDTSGALVVAKNQKAFEFLKKQFQERTVTKKYLAVVYGNVKNDKGVIDRPIGRSKSDFRKWSATRGARGEMREAVTEYKVLKRFHDRKGEPFTLLEVSPKTGRTHQIRVHLKAINYSIVGDKLYGGARLAALGFKRTALHAGSVSFETSPGKKVTVLAPLPADFQEVAVTV
jgi:23S rRNA pseudouridine1911/1915/1917 synthase